MYIKKGLGIVLGIIILITIEILNGPVMAQKKYQIASDEPEWAKVNNEIISKYNIKGRERDDIPDTRVQSNVGAGKVINLMSLPPINLAEGVYAKAYWGIGALISFVDMRPNSIIPPNTLNGERFLFVLKGDIEEVVDGKYVRMESIEREIPGAVTSITPRVDFVYKEKGDISAVKAGSRGAKILEVYSPVPPFYLEASGMINIPAEIGTTLKNFPVSPSVLPNRVYDLHDFQYAELVPGANSRVISGKNVMMSFIRMDPNTVFDYHIHPEEQIMVGMRGWINEYMLADTVRMEQGDVVRFPRDYTHGGQQGPLGCDALDVFFPPRTDYDAFRKARQQGFDAVIPSDSKVELLIDGAKTKPGLTFTEGPAWLNGKLYFSNIHFDKDFNGSPEKSSTVVVNEDGSYHYIKEGLLTNGMMPSGDGNLIVCDMFGHRVVKMSPEGKIIKVLAESYQGKSLDGPNDLVMDSRGGIYFTDPQFTPESKKFQPGRTAYYLTPKGTLIRLLEPNSFAMPNGIVLSPDGKTLYINNTYDSDPSWNITTDKGNYIWAYDVKEDGTITNGRQFAELYLTGQELDRKSKSSGADGMTIDEQGNLYVATYKGVQIFNSKGDFTGIINLPTYPTNLCFGGKDFKTLYIVSHDKVYSVRTNVRGFMVTNKK